MKKRENIVEKYYLNIFNKILSIAPFVALVAALTFTTAKLLGFFKDTSIINLVVFDIICLTYFLIANFFKKFGIRKDGRIDSKKVIIVQYVLSIITILQWNLISYIFPSRDFFSYAAMFVLLNAFLFEEKVVLFDMIGMTISITISWIINGDKLLPARDDMFIENLTLRIVSIIITCIIIYLLTVFAHRFMKKTEEATKDLELQNDTLYKMNKDIISFTADIIERRDETSGKHVKRMKDFVYILGTEIMNSYPEYDLTVDKIEEISLASSLHDIGKISIPDRILLKPSKLTKEEFEIIKTHTTKGAEMIESFPKSIDESFKKCCFEICKYHHEKWDGNGYPCGLKGDEIPISAQIVSVIDCLDALTSKRPYKDPYTKEEALKMILDGECGMFSDKILNSLKKCIDKFEL